MYSNNFYLRFSHVENTQEKYVPVGGMALRYKVHDFIRYFTESVELLEDIPHMLLSAQSLVWAGNT